MDTIPVITRRQDMPGYADAMRAAFARQQENREHSFLDYPRAVAGFPVRPLTLRLWALLDALENPFVAGGRLTPAAALAALWVLSPQFLAGQGLRARWRKLKHVARYRLLAHAYRRRGLRFDLVGQVRRFFDDAFLDAPGGPPDPGFGEKPPKPLPPPYTAIFADCVDRLAAHYHWREGDILDLPLARLWQYRNAILLRTDRDYSPNQLTDVVNRDYARRFKKYQDELAAANPSDFSLTLGTHSA